MTSLFADIVGSTALGEFLPKDEVKVLVGDCISRISEVVETYGGVIGAYMGDGVAAFFGIETADEDDNVKAALSALEIRKTVARYADEVRSAWGVANFNVRVGINSGRVATGLVGSGNPQLLALGDCVNVAARLQSVAVPGSVVVGASVADRLGPRFAVRRLGPVQLKGREEPVVAYELLGEEYATQTDIRRPIVGREHERAHLRDAVLDLCSGRGQIALFVGDAGIGKTRLLAELRDIASNNVIWLEARTELADRRLPYGPFAEVLRSWLDVNPGTPEVAVRTRLQAKVHELVGSDDEELLPALARVLGVRLNSRLEQRLDGLPADVLIGNLHRAYCKWLTILAQTAPIVLSLDNFGHVDEASEQLAEEVAAITDVSPVLVAVSMRPDAGSAGWQLRTRALSDYAYRTLELRIGPLAESEARTLLDMLDVDDVLADAVKAKLVRRAEGNPLYLEELYHAVAGLGPSIDDDVGLPAALEAVLLSRIDRLPLPARKLLQAAAILGRDFSKQVLESMDVVDDTGGALGLLIRRDLLRERRRHPVEFTFKHGLLQDAALATLTTTTRRELHRRAATAIESTYGPDLREHIESLTHHYLACGDEAKVSGLLEGIGERLVSLYRYDQATDFLERCRLQARRDGDESSYHRVTLRSAELRSQAGDGVGALSLLREAEASEANDGQQFRVAVLRSQILMNTGDLAGAADVLTECELTPRTPAEEGTLLTMEAQVAIRRQDLARVHDYLQRVGDIGRLEPEVAFEAATVWSGFYAAQGDFSSALRWGERALALASQTQKATLELRAQRYAGVLRLLHGDVATSYELLMGAFESCGNLGHFVGEVECGINLIHSAHLFGALQVGEEVGHRILRDGLPPFWESLVRCNLATIKFELDDLSGAEELAHRAVAIAGEIGAVPTRIGARTQLAGVAMARRQWDDAQRYLEEVRREAEQLPGRFGHRVVVQAALGELALALGDWHRAVREAEIGLIDLRYAERPTHVPLLRVLGVGLAHSSVRRGLQLLSEVQRMASSMGMRLEEARTFVAMGQVSTSDSEGFLAQAERIFAATGCRRGLAEVADVRCAIHADSSC